MLFHKYVRILLNEGFLQTLFKNIILYIILIDILVFGIYFGSSHIIDRFYFLENEFSEIPSTDQSFTRFHLIKFAFHNVFNYLSFGYGPGSFEILFQNKFPNLESNYVNHAHSDLFQFIGEFGIVGIVLLFLSILNFFFKFLDYNLKSFVLLFFIIIILFFDFSLHIPIIQLLFVCFFFTNQKYIKSYSSR